MSDLRNLWKTAIVQLNKSSAYTQHASRLEFGCRSAFPRVITGNSCTILHILSWKACKCLFFFSKLQDVQQIFGAALKKEIAGTKCNFLNIFELKIMELKKQMVGTQSCNSKIKTSLMFYLKSQKLLADIKKSRN